MITRFTFGDEALVYLLSRLELGGTLARHLTELPLSTGQVSAFLPDDVSREAAQDFEGGEVIPLDWSRAQHVDGMTLVPVRTRPEGKETEKALERFIQDYLGAGTNRCLLFAGNPGAPDDPWIREHSIQAIFHNKEVYNFLKAPLADISQVAEFRLLYRASWLDISILTRIPNGVELIGGANVSSEVIKELADSADHIILGAWDGEGELIWSRQWQETAEGSALPRIS